LDYITCFNTSAIASVSRLHTALIAHALSLCLTLDVFLLIYFFIDTVF